MKKENSFMDWIRSALGVTPTLASTAASSKNKVVQRHYAKAEEESHEDRAAKFARAQALRIRLKERERADLKDQVDECVRVRDVNRGKQLHLQLKQVDQELAAMRAKHENVSRTGQVIRNANANLEQALLVKESADELEQATQAMQEIDLDTAVDKLRDGVDEVREHDTLLCEPIFGDVILEEEADDEFDQMVRERDERQAMQVEMPSVTDVLPNVPTKEHVPEAEMSEIKNDSS